MARYHALFYAAPMTLNNAAAVYALVSMSGAGNAVVVGSSIVSFILLFIVLGDWFRALGLERDLRANTQSIEEVAMRWTT